MEPMLSLSVGSFLVCFIAFNCFLSTACCDEDGSVSCTGMCTSCVTRILPSCPVYFLTFLLYFVNQLVFGFVTPTSGVGVGVVVTFFVLLLVGAGVVLSGLFL